MTPEGIEWSSQWGDIVKDAGVEDRAKLAPVREARAPLGRTKFQRATVDEEGSEAEADVASVMADRHTLVCHATLELSVDTDENNARFYLRTVLEMRLAEVSSGQFLPLKEAERCDFAGLIVREAKRKHRERRVIYRRPQIYKLAPGATVETATDYLLDLRDEGIENVRQVSIISRSESEHNMTQEARTLMASMTARDVWELRGPRTKASSLQQVQQPIMCAECSDADGSDNEEAEDAPAESDPWEAEFQADLEAEAEMMIDVL